MIFGVGIDVVRLDRMERAYRRFGQRFVDRLLLPQEMSAFESNKRPARFLAMRFAAKEAVLKMLGTGLRRGITWRDIEVRRAEPGRVADLITDEVAVVSVTHVNYRTGDVVPNAVLTQVATDGTICIYTVAATHLLVDVTGHNGTP